MVKYKKGKPWYHNPLHLIWAVPAGLIAAGVLAFLFGWLIQLLWNALLPQLFGWKAITYWQGVGLFLLVKLFFGFGGHGSPGGGKKKHSCEEWEDWDEDEWEDGGRWKYWKHYRTYWKDEGKAQFEAYLQRKGLSEEEKKDEKPRSESSLN